MDLIGAEIFAPGKWNGLEFTENDIDEIVANFDTLQGIHKVPLKFGHDEDHKDGQPALGWVERIYKKGSKLVADFVDMPKTVYDAIKKKLYRSVSIELLFNVDHNGTKYNHVLDAVALLGADHPAVNTLADLDTLLASRSGLSGGQRHVFETIAGKRKSTTDEVIDMDEKQVQELIASAVEPLKEANKEQTEEIKKLKAERDSLEQKIKDSEKEEHEKAVKLRRKEITDILDGAVKERKMLPAAREAFSKQLGLDNDEKVLDIDVEQVKVMCSYTKGAEDEGETGMHEQNTGESAEDKLTRLTYDAMSKSGEESFAVAFSTVARANPKLHREYLDANGVKGGD